MNQRIISEIRNDTCNTNVALACEIGVSRATISWHMRRLKEIGLVKETKKRKKTLFMR
ncbi:winged helix-turn-helix transcriptional regulator [Methanosarcina horonobensis]|uniref:winged helix-turn-helix transcriptional regulator n=1 Tax=Methanosarcina horonobensis TaxID=418008 RepID=UPI0022B8DD93|nr:winged helix-turn-helix transcriptional regulator [Methanosarcina horonobensis]